MITIIPTAINAGFFLDFLTFLGLFASERFFRHLPDLVLSLSFDHFPFFTLGAGKNLTSIYPYLFYFPIYRFIKNWVFSNLKKIIYKNKHKLKLRLLFYTKLPMGIQAMEETANKIGGFSTFGKSKNRVHKKISQKINGSFSRKVYWEFR